MKLSQDEIRRIKRDAGRYDDAPSLKEYIEMMEENQPEHDDIGVIEFEAGRPRQAKIPTLAYDGLEIDLLFTVFDGSVSAVVP